MLRDIDVYHLTSIQFYIAYLGFMSNHAVARSIFHLDEITERDYWYIFSVIVKKMLVSFFYINVDLPNIGSK